MKITVKELKKLIKETSDGDASASVLVATINGWAQQNAAQIVRLKRLVWGDETTDAELKLSDVWNEYKRASA